MRGSILGHPVLRSEDPKLLTGDARYTDDLRVEGALHAVFVRSPFAHARITGIDTAGAGEMPGVQGVYTASDLGLAPLPAGNVPDAFAQPVLAQDVVRYVGEPVAVLVAETRRAALDAAESVFVDYEPLPAVVDVFEAIEDSAPVLFEEHGSNIVVHKHRGEVDLSSSEVVVEARFVNQRLAPAPMEPGGGIAQPDSETGGLLLRVPCQAPFPVARDVGRALGLKRGQVHVAAPTIGGGFGTRIQTYPEYILIAALALRLGGPVRYVESRTESMTTFSHGRAQVQEVKVGARRDGTLTSLKIRLVADLGAYPAEGEELPRLTRLMSVGVYRIPEVEYELVDVVTNKTPVAAYRGAGRPEASALIERVVDMVAAELGLDPVEIRKRNFIPKDAFPYKTPTRAKYDSGDYERPLDEALALAGYDELRSQQRQRREAGDVKQLGIGLSTYVEVTGFGADTSSVEIHEDGGATVRTGISPHGQGHETSLAQLVAAETGIPMEAITVVHSDTRVVPKGEGTMGSRSLQVGGSAVAGARDAVIEKAKLVASNLMEVSPDDIVITEEGRLGVVGVPERSVSWGEVARAASAPDSLPEGVEPGLSAEHRFDYGDDKSFPFGAHVAVVEVDTETGEAELLRHIAVDDCGRILNPMLVRGQQHGGVAQGVAQALFEEMVYDEGGNPLTSSFVSYMMPSAADLPSFETANTETPSPLNPLGAKGIGESGTIGSTPAVQNAVVDAVAHLGVRHIDMPCTPARVWDAIRAARA